MKKKLKLGCAVIAALIVILLSVLAFIRTRAVDVEYVKLPPQPENNSFYQYARLAVRTVDAATQSYALREGRRLLPFRGDANLRADYMAAISDIRDQYRKLAGLPFMPPKRFSAEEMPLDTAGIGYWITAESTVLDDLLTAGRFGEAAKQLFETFSMSHQLMSYGDFSTVAMAGFLQTRAQMVIGDHFSRIPREHAHTFANAIKSSNALRRPITEAIDAQEAAAILFFKNIQKDSRLFWSIYVDWRDTARRAKSNFDHLRAQARKPIAEREFDDIPEDFAGLLFAAESEMNFYELPLVRSQMLFVAFSIRDYLHVNGHYPQKLGDVNLGKYKTDPFTDDELLYKTGKDGFLLYARGWDGKDDGGKRALGFDAPNSDVGVLQPGRAERKEGQLVAPPLWLK